MATGRMLLRADTHWLEQEWTRHALPLGCPLLVGWYFPYFAPSVPSFNSSPWLRSGIWYVMSNFYSGEQLFCTAENMLQRPTSISNTNWGHCPADKELALSYSYVSASTAFSQVSCNLQDASGACAHVRWQHLALPVSLASHCAFKSALSAF